VLLQAHKPTYLIHHPHHLKSDSYDDVFAADVRTAILSIGLKNMTFGDPQRLIGLF